MSGAQTAAGRQIAAAPKTSCQSTSSRPGWFTRASVPGRPAPSVSAVRSVRQPPRHRCRGGDLHRGPPVPSSSSSPPSIPPRSAPPSGCRTGSRWAATASSCPPRCSRRSRGVAAQLPESSRHGGASGGRARLRLDERTAAAGPVRRDVHRHAGRPHLRAVPARAPGAADAHADPGRRRHPGRRRKRRAAARARQTPAPAERYRTGPGAGPPALGTPAEAAPADRQPLPLRGAGRDDRAARPGSIPARRRPASRAFGRSIRTSTSRSTSCPCRARTPSSGAARSGSSSLACTASASATSARSRSGSTTSCWPRARSSGFANGEVDLDAGWHDILVRFVDQQQLRVRHGLLAAARPPARDHPDQRAAALASLAGRGSPSRRRRYRRARGSWPPPPTPPA